jgi:pyridoxamine 5'-phosphate oxidase
MSNSELTNGDFFEHNEPLALFRDWLDEASRTEPNDPNAVALATVDRAGMPNVRMVLLKGFDMSGFVFYTNFESVKGQEILGSMKAALCFHWKSLRRQVRIRGEVEIVADDEAGQLLPVTPSRQPDRSLGVAAVTTTGKPVRA